MAQPGFYPHPVRDLVHLQTHISHIFLTGDFVYKLKKPLDLGFLDFRELGERRRLCLRELELNRRLAPGIYLEVLAVVDGPGGLELAPLDREQGALEYCLKMAEMDQERMMDRLLAQGQVETAQVHALARILSEFYAANQGGPEVAFHGRRSQVLLNVEENFRQTRQFVGTTVSAARWRAIRDYSLGFLREHGSLFQDRVSQGRIVDGHGDLHSANINLPVGGEPIIFDCIEFNDRFRFQDAVCDLAFLAMDLDFNQRADLSSALMERYSRLSGDRDIEALTDFYKCYRAVVRAKVFDFLLEDPDETPVHKRQDLAKAKAYFRLAASYAGNEPPYFLVCLMGKMGTGKSYLARHLARLLGWPLLSTDLARKEMAGKEPGERSADAWGQGLYTPEKTAAVYRHLARRAGSGLAMGESVLMEASFGREDWRGLFLDLAEEHGATPLFLEVCAPRQVVLERLARRWQSEESASDGRPELVARQDAAWQEASARVAANLVSLEGQRPVEENAAIVCDHLRGAGWRPDEDPKELS